jgi:hypothetical protein
MDNGVEDVAVTVNTSTKETRAKYFVLACLMTNQPYANLDEKPYCETDFLSRMYDYVFDCKKSQQAPQIDMIYTLCPNASEEEYSQIVDVDFSKQKQESNKLEYEQDVATIKVELLLLQQKQVKKMYSLSPEQRPNEFKTDGQIDRKLQEISRQIAETVSKPQND